MPPTLKHLNSKMMVLYHLLAMLILEHFKRNENMYLPLATKKHNNLLQN